jgi:uncharacterized protein YebE (UPF0316 family)
MEYSDRMETNELIQFVIIPILIFCSRILDVSIGTFRIILVSRGHKLAAPLLGFVEVIIWLIAITQVMKNLSNVISYLAYVSGFAFGNYVGMWLEGKIALGFQLIRVVSDKELETIPIILRGEGFAVTTVKGRGTKSQVNIFFTVVHRKNVSHVLEVVQNIEPDAFITIEDVRKSYSGYIKPRTPFRIAKKK